MGKLPSSRITRGKPTGKPRGKYGGKAEGSSNFVSGPPSIRDTLKDSGLAPSKSRGQNFLKDVNYINRIVATIIKCASAQYEPGEATQVPLASDEPCPIAATNVEIMEIGPGLGALTKPLLETGSRVLAIELDRGLVEVLATGLALDFPETFTMLHQDVLTLTQSDLQSPAPRFLCGNLPYNISSQVLFWLLTHRHNFCGAVFMLQKEMAKRLVAGPGDKDYGRLAAALGLWFKVDYLFTVPPSSFYPRPKVESSLVRLTLDLSHGEPEVDPETFSRFTAAAFAAPRKTIFNNLVRTYGRVEATKALDNLELDQSLRPGTLNPAILAKLAGLLAGSGSVK